MTTKTNKKRKRSKRQSRTEQAAANSAPRPCDETGNTMTAFVHANAEKIQPLFEAVVESDPASALNFIFRAIEYQYPKPKSFEVSMESNYSPGHALTREEFITMALIAAKPFGSRH